MQSYREDSGSRPVTQLDPLPPPSARLDDMSKYQARYEEAMNPFEAFRGRVCYYCYVTGIKFYSFKTGSYAGIPKSQSS
jgi:homeobox protein cut-like